MQGVAAYGMVTSFDVARPGLAAAPVTAVAGPPAGQSWADVLRVNRWESGAVGAVVIIALAVYVNTLLD